MRNGSAPIAGLAAEGDRLETVFPPPRVLVLTKPASGGGWWGHREPKECCWLEPALTGRHRTKRLCLFSEPVVQR